MSHPVTYGELEDEKVLTHAEDRGSKQTLDYIFEVIDTRVNQDDVSNEIT